MGRLMSLVLLILAVTLVNGLSFQLKTDNFSIKRIPRLTLSENRPTRTNVKLHMAIVGPVRYSTRDWVDCIRTLPSSRILARTKWNILCFMGWTTFVTILFKVVAKQMVRFQIPPTVHSVLGPALSLLLVFRTNSSYDRFWEGRKAQSSIIVACRNIATHSYVHVPRERHKDIAALLAAYVLIQKQHLQGVVNDEELGPLLPADKIQVIQSKRNRPLYILRELEHLIHSTMAEKYRHAPSTESTTSKYIEKHFIECLHQLSAQLAACERILKQPVPLSYSRHTSRFLSLYIFLLPFSLVGSMGWMTIPAVSVIHWALISIQEIAHFIEEPFDRRTQIIPLNQIATLVRADCSEILDGVLDSPDCDRMEALLMQETVKNSRPGPEGSLNDYSRYSYY